MKNQKLNLIFALFATIITISISNNISCMDNCFVNIGEEETTKQNYKDEDKYEDFELLIKAANRTKEEEQKLIEQLFKACAYGDLKTVRYLIEKEKIEPNIKDEYGNLPIEAPIIKGYLDIVKYLIEKQSFKFDAQNKHIKNLIKIIYQYNRFEIFKYFVEKKYIKLDTFDEYGNKPIHTACEYNSFDIVKYLIEEQGIKPDTPSFLSKEQPIILCCYNFRSYNNVPPAKTFKYLIEKCGISPDTVDKDGNSLIILCIKYPDLNKIKYLVEEKKIYDKFELLQLQPLIKSLEVARSYNSAYSNEIASYFLNKFIKSKIFRTKWLNGILFFDDYLFSNTKNLKLILEHIRNKKLLLNCIKSTDNKTLVEGFIDSPYSITSLLSNNQTAYQNIANMLSNKVKTNNLLSNFLIQTLKVCRSEVKNSKYINIDKEKISKYKKFGREALNIYIIFKIISGCKNLSKVEKKNELKRIKTSSKINIPDDCIAHIMKYYCNNIPIKKIKKPKKK